MFALLSVLSILWLKENNERGKKKMSYICLFKETYNKTGTVSLIRELILIY